MIDAIREPLNEFYGEMFSLSVSRERGNPINYPDKTKPEDTISETALEMRKRIAVEKLERQLRDGLQDQNSESNGQIY